MINKKPKKMIRSSILNLLFHIHHSFSLLGGAQMRDMCVCVCVLGGQGGCSSDKTYSYENTV